MTLPYQRLIDAFQPAKEISDPQRFSGRVQQVESGAELLLGRNHIFIHGIRGIGKSSLARQLAHIAGGDTRLLSSLGSTFAGESFDFATCFLTRDASIRSVNDLIYRIMVDVNGLAQWYDLLEIPELGGYELATQLNTQLVAEFWRRIEKCSKLTRDGVAIFVDEFELIADHTGFASLLKAAPDRCIFVVTGIGKTEKDLVRDHQSIERQLDTGKLEVPEMSADELRQIVSKAEAYINQEVTFSDGAKERLIAIAKGHPYLLHLVGRQALRAAFKGKLNSVSVEVIREALGDIARSRADRLLEERYLKAIGNSPLREIVLRLFAAAESDSVHTSAVYPLATAQSVSNPSYWVGDLQKEQYGAELEKVADHYYRVRDPLFCAYVAATPPRLGDEVNRERPEGVPSENVKILHLSDVHFGPRHFFSNLPASADSLPDADRPSLYGYLHQWIETLGAESPDLLVVSGDVTQSAMTDEFREAEEFVKKTLSLIAKEVPGGRKPIVVPGNHDVNWGMRAADPGARYAGFSSYVNFLRQLGRETANAVEPERLYEVHDHVDALGCLVVGFNSAVLEHADDHRGYIGESQMRNALQEADTVQGRRAAVRIAVFHHHVHPVSTLEASLQRQDETLRDAAFVKASLLEAGFRLVLHGHRHHAHEEVVGDGTRLMAIVGCGSTGVVVEERGSQPLQFNVISLQRYRSPVSIGVRRYVFDVNRRRWLPSEDHPLRTFEVGGSPYGTLV